jgi:hypothetical protein
LVFRGSDILGPHIYAIVRRPRHLRALRPAGFGAHIRIEARCAIASVHPKSRPLNNSGARMTAETA